MNYAAATLAFAFLLSLAPSVAMADDQKLADQHVASAKAAIGMGHVEEAIKEYELAYRANPLPKYLYNIAYLHGRLAEAGAADAMRRAYDFYRRYLDVYPQAPDRAAVEARLTELRAKIDRAEEAARETTIHQPPTPTKQPDLTSPTPSPPKRSPVGAIVGGSVAGLVLVGGIVGIGVGVSSSGASPPFPTTPSLGVWSVTY